MPVFDIQHRAAESVRVSIWTGTDRNRLVSLTDCKKHCISNVLKVELSWNSTFFKLNLFSKSILMLADFNISSIYLIYEIPYAIKQC